MFFCPPFSVAFQQQIYSIIKQNWPDYICTLQQKFQSENVLYVFSSQQEMKAATTTIDLKWNGYQTKAVVLSNDQLLGRLRLRSTIISFMILQNSNKAKSLHLQDNMPNSDQIQTVKEGFCQTSSLKAPENVLVQGIFPRSRQDLSSPSSTDMTEIKSHHFTYKHPPTQSHLHPNFPAIGLSLQPLHSSISTICPRVSTVPQHYHLQIR